MAIHESFIREIWGGGFGGGTVGGTSEHSVKVFSLNSFFFFFFFHQFAKVSRCMYISILCSNARAPVAQLIRALIRIQRTQVQILGPDLNVLFVMKLHFRVHD